VSSDASWTLAPPATPAGRLLDDVRRRLMSAIVVVVAIVGIPVVSSSVYRAKDIGFRPVMAVQIAAVVAFLLLAALRHRLPSSLLTGVVFVLIPVNAAVALLAFGLVGQGLLMILAWATVVAIFSGLRWGLAAAVTGVAALAVVGVAVVHGALGFDVDFDAYAVSGSSWMNAVLGCAFWTLLTAGCVGRSHAELVAVLQSAEDRSVELEALNRRLRRLAAQLEAAEDAERRRLAGVLHDGVGQTLYAAKLRLGTLFIAENERRSTAGADEALRLIDEAIAQSRSLTRELFPQILHDSGPAAALEWLADEHRCRHEVRVDFEQRTSQFDASEPVALVLYQTVRELLHNTAKHARAGVVRVTLDRRDDMLEVTVADDGVGFEIDSPGADDQRRDGFGLFSISERLEHVGGTLDIRSRPGDGTTAMVTVPRLPEPEGRT